MPVTNEAGPLFTLEEFWAYSDKRHADEAKLGVAADQLEAVYATATIPTPRTAETYAQPEEYGRLADEILICGPASKFIKRYMAMQGPQAFDNLMMSLDRKKPIDRLLAAVDLVTSEPFVNSMELQKRQQHPGVLGKFKNTADKVFLESITDRESDLWSGLSSLKQELGERKGKIAAGALVLSILGSGAVVAAKPASHSAKSPIAKAYAKNVVVETLSPQALKSVQNPQLLTAVAAATKIELSNHQTLPKNATPAEVTQVVTQNLNTLNKQLVAKVRAGEHPSQLSSVTASHVKSAITTYSAAAKAQASFTPADQQLLTSVSTLASTIALYPSAVPSELAATIAQPVGDSPSGFHARATVANANYLQAQDPTLGHENAAALGSLIAMMQQPVLSPEQQEIAISAVNQAAQMAPASTPEVQTTSSAPEAVPSTPAPTTAPSTKASEQAAQPNVSKAITYTGKDLALAKQVMNSLAPAEKAFFIKNYAAFDAAAKKYNLPTELLMALKYRETGASMTNPNNGQGLFQIANGSGGDAPAPAEYAASLGMVGWYTPGEVSETEFERQLDFAAGFAANKEHLMPTDLQGITYNSRDMNVAEYRNMVGSLSEDYNGHPFVYDRQGAAISGSTDPDLAWEGSPYAAAGMSDQQDGTKNPNGFRQFKYDHGFRTAPANKGYGAVPLVMGFQVLLAENGVFGTPAAVTSTPSIPPKPVSAPPTARPTPETTATAQTPEYSLAPDPNLPGYLAEIKAQLPPDLIGQRKILATMVLHDPNIVIAPSPDDRVLKSFQEVAETGMTFKDNVNNNLDVGVNPYLLVNLLVLSKAGFKVTVWSLTTGEHAVNSQHYTGDAEDEFPQSGAKADAQKMFAYEYANRAALNIDQMIYDFAPSGTALLNQGQPTTRAFYGEPLLADHAGHEHDSFLDHGQAIPLDTPVATMSAAVASPSPSPTPTPSAAIAAPSPLTPEQLANDNLLGLNQ